MVFAGRIIVTTAYSCCLISPCRCSVQDKEEKKQYLSTDTSPYLVVLLYPK